MGADLSSKAWEIMCNATNKIITKLDSSKAIRCDAKIHISSRKTRTHSLRVAKALREGRAIDSCGQKAVWRINGHNYCRSHAGQEAINALVILSNGGTL